MIASCSDDATIKLWDFETGAYENTLKGHSGPINYIRFSIYYLLNSLDKSIEYYN